MRNLLFSFLLASALAYPQVGAPRLGFVRTPDGSVRALRGVSGSFTFGERVMQGVDRLWFDGRRGVAMTAAGQVHFDAAGTVQRHGDQRAGTPPFPDPGASWSGDEITITANGIRLRAPFEVRSVERVGAEYLLVSGGGQRRLLRTTAGREALYEVPEAAE